MRRCPKCNQDLDESLFKRRSNGSFQAYCIECKKIIDREYQARKRAEKNIIEKNETVLPKNETVASQSIKDYQKIIYCECEDWVPIDDHLPDQDGRYLITQIGTNTFEQASKGVKVPVVGIMTLMGGHFLTENVQAWRPIPEPYKHVKPVVTPAPWYKRQPLGYKDRNGKEIREGDVLNIETVTRYNYKGMCPRVLYWDKRSIGVASCKLYEMNGDTLHGVPYSVLSQCEIIGSIYDLKHLKETVITEEYFTDSNEYEKAKTWLKQGGIE